MSVQLVAIGGSAGAIEALQRLLPALPNRSDIAYAIVLHRAPAETDERLESLLNSWSTVPVSKARDGAPIVAGRAVVAPADLHLTVDGSHFRLTAGPKENRTRPSIDVTFRSVAAHFGARAAAIVLSGMLDDGANGIREIRDHGGLTIVQTPEEALHADMPRNAIAAGAEYAVEIERMPELLEAFAKTARDLTVERRKHALEGELTRLTCPDCGGVLAEQYEGDASYFRCRVGHGYASETLHAEKGSEIEDALWTAIQVLEEQVDLAKRVVRRAQSNGNTSMAQRFQRRAERLRSRAEAVRRALPSVEDAFADSESRPQIDSAG